MVSCHSRVPIQILSTCPDCWKASTESVSRLPTWPDRAIVLTSTSLCPATFPLEVRPVEVGLHSLVPTQIVFWRIIWGYTDIPTFFIMQFKSLTHIFWTFCGPLQMPSTHFLHFYPAPGRMASVWDRAVYM